MRRAACLLTFALVCLTTLVGRASAAPTVVASLKLPDTSSWQPAGMRNSDGNWVKHSSPVVADLGYGYPIILVGNRSGTLYALRYIKGDPTLHTVWSFNVSTPIDSSPAVGDLNGDGCPEVIFGASEQSSHAGVWVLNCHGKQEWFASAPARGPGQVGVFATPAIGDVNGDHRPDVVYGGWDKYMYARDAKGKLLPGWPHDNYDTIWSSPSLADINGDGTKEIITGTDLGGGAAVFGCSKPTRGTLKIFNGSGGFMPNFPKCFDTPIWSSPAVQDLNGDGHLDVIIGTNNYNEGGYNVGDASVVRAFDTKTGALLWQTHLQSGSRIFASPAIGDVGSDGSLDVAIGEIHTNGGDMYELDARTGHIKWKRDVGCTRPECEFMGSALIADVTGDGKPDVIANAQDGGLNVWDANGNAVLHELKPFHVFAFDNSPAVADLDGDGKNEIVLAGGMVSEQPRPGAVWVISTSGRGTGPWPFFRKTIDRIGAIGTGSAGGGGGSSYKPPVSSGPARPYRPSTGSHAPKATATTTATTSPTDEPTATDVATTSPSGAFAAPNEPPSHTASHNNVLALIAGVCVLGSAALGFVGWRRFRSAE